MKPAEPPRCMATLTDPNQPPHWCDKDAGHYDATREPEIHPDAETSSNGWHEEICEFEPVIWCDDADGATPHQDLPNPVEPDSPAATALAQHIADHPMSTVQAAFRILGMRLSFELHEAKEDQP